MQKGQTLILLLIGILVIASGVFYLKFKRPESFEQRLSRQNPEIIPSISPQSNNKPTPDTKPQEDETLTWKTYSDTKYHYSVKYPNSLNVTIGDQYNPGSVTFGKKSDNINPSGYEIGVMVLPAKNKTLKEIADHYDTYKTRAGYTRLETTVDTISGYKVTNVAMDFPTDAVSLLKDENEYFIFVKYFEQNQSIKTEGEKIFNQILSTFKFQ